MTDTLTEVRASLQEAADASEVPAYQRLQRLRAIRAELAEALEAADEFIDESEVAREGLEVETALGVLSLRQRATISESMLTAGTVTAEQLAEAGVLDHSDLDALDEEGLLEGVARELIDAGRIEVDPGWTDGADDDAGALTELGEAVLAGTGEKPEDQPENG